MLSTATTSTQHPANFWFTTNPLPSFFSSSTGTQKHSFDPHRCSDNSGQFHYLPANHFLSRDDWSTIPIPTSPTWNKGNERCHPIDTYRCSNAYSMIRE